MVLDPKVCPECGGSFSPHHSDQLCCSRKCGNSRSGRRKRKPKKRCEVCGELFKAVSKDQRYCSYDCSGFARRKRIRRQCAHCGKQFEAKASEVRKGAGRFCSKDCWYASKTLPPIKRRCPTCNQAFTIQPYELNTPRRIARYCSRECYMSSPSFPPPTWTTTGLSFPERQMPATEATCERCNESFPILPGHRKNRRFCSTDCWYEHVREHPEEWTFFKRDYERYYGPNWREQARRARKRDGYTCQRCGVHQTKPALDVHHIRRFAAFKGDYESANRLENLITLCKTCHLLVERGGATVQLELQL